ncbi:MAG: valine--tRNA ligase [Bacilli bacterium]
MLENKYNHLNVEKGKYDVWKNKGYFSCGDKTKKPYCIVIPPPNVTGKLHLGHAWDTALQDIIIRFKRMQGYDCLWLPGMDHAGIATQAKVDARLRSEGINPRSLTREEWLEHAWSWKQEYADSIHQQWAELGLSLDYSKERFTLDEGLNYAVRKVFVDLYNKGLIYRGERIINWDPVQMTALSTEEVIYRDVKGAFYHIKYFIEGTNDYLDVATTRPETLFGDTAVAVNPNDERYKHLIGKKVILPIVNKLIPIVGDEHADPEFGTGVVKITPAHDPNDFEVGNRHNLERIVVMNADATMNANAGKYEGMSREVCREELLKDLKEQDLLINIEEMTHSVGHSERSNAMIEPYLSKQWFVKMRPLADRVLENQKNRDTKVNFVPARYEKIMNHWMEITYDWCISRQLWWGHRIPVWYKGEEIYCGMEAPNEEGWVQDSDVLDTWFSSALWPFSTLGWPNNTEDMERYYPNNCLVTGYDIIPFWVNRMTFQGLEFTGERPFKDCLIHGLIRDKQGRKFSKSLGNGVDPMDMCQLYGADSLRYYLTTTAANGTDIKFDEEKIKATWNFINKLWNASRFVLLNIEGLKEIKSENLKLEDKWILTKYEETVKEVTKFMDKYEFNNAGNSIYAFTWNCFCDNYIEMAKFSLDSASTKSTLTYVLTGILKMLQPFMPFVTDELYNQLPIKDSEAIMVSRYPEYNKELLFKEEEKIVDNQIDFIRLFRNIKAENNITKEAKVKLNNHEDYSLIIKMLKLKDSLITQDLNLNSYNVLSGVYDMTIYFEKVITEEELKLKEKQINDLKNSIARRKNLLANVNYVNKAPQALVEKERETLASEEELLKTLEGK